MKSSSENRFTIIMAGGTGTRLWPLSRKEKPKQFHNLISSKTLLQETYERVSRIVPEDHIYISTTSQYRDLVKENLPNITDDKLIIEPLPRGTAPAIALSAFVVSQRHPDAVVATVASDHAIRNVDEFIASLDTAFLAAEDRHNALVTVGINPTIPSTEFGYIKMGNEIQGDYAKRIFSVDAFVEKPDYETAKKYLAAWEYLWNAGYFIFHAKTFLHTVEKFTPKIAKALQKVAPLMNSGKADSQEVQEVYAELDNEPIDTAIVEKMDKDKRIVVPSELQWDDIGNWSALFDFLKNSHGSSMIVKGNNIDVESDGCFIYGKDKLIATLGLKDLVVIETADAVFIADRKRAQEVKKIIDKLKEDGKHLYL